MASLNPLSGALGKRLAAHLLRRATYKITPQRIEEFALLTAAQAVDKLFTFPALKYPDGPLWHKDGQKLFNLDNLHTSKIYVTPEIANLFSMGIFAHAWRLAETVDDTSARWKIVTWLNSMFTNYHDSNQMAYYFYRLLENQAVLGDLRTLAKKVTLENSMLTYLSNHYNRKGALNENYAREFLELFTILKGPAIGVGNYTNYTEADITQAARVLTSFIAWGTSSDPETGICSGRAYFAEHDTGNKTFSAAFQNRTIIGATNEADMYRELSDFVNMVYEQTATAKSFVRRMYLFFVSDNVTPEVETQIINPLATELLANGYKHIPILKKMLTSEHFYDRDDTDGTDEIIGSKIKSPMELIFQSVNVFNLVSPTATQYNYVFAGNFWSYYHHTETAGMSMFGPDTVEGFPGYYKEPGFSKNWVKASALYKRYSIHKSLLRGKVYDTEVYFPYKLDIVKWVKDTIDLPSGPGTPAAPIGAANATRVVTMMMDYMLAEVPKDIRYDYFKNALLGGLSPVNWYFSWKNYLATGDDMDVRVGLERLLKAFMSSSEYQTF
jgi:uncharacterized protein (DUF1800 family)